MNKLITALFIFISFQLNSQPPADNANDIVPNYTTPFRLGVNPGYNGTNWTDETLAELAAGNASQGIDGAGIKSLRIPLPENFLETWGYNIREATFDYYTTLGLLDNTVFLEEPSPAHQDMTEYCPGTPSIIFDKLYEPIWDGGTNGTPVNEDNYFALYVYKTVNIYKDEVKFWEVWNEPDFDYSNSGWKPPGWAGNWWENVPDPCDYKLQAPVYYYIRMLRITYEVVKSIDPNAFVTTGGIGYESFLDIILRFTDNPVDGSVDPVDYPHTGGAYFDALSIHTYPHQNGSLRYWDNNCQCWIDDRHSDAAAIGVVNHKNSFETVLTDYDYDGITYPKKPFIITETHIPNVQLSNFIGSYEAQRNYDIKAIVYAYANDIRQMDLFKLADTEPAATAWSWTQVSGLYEPINVAPYTVIHNESGIATRTTMDLIFGLTYDATRTAALNLPSNISGGAFATSNGYLYVLWAKTSVDQSETASGTYSFPAGLGVGNLDRMEWDFSTTGSVSNIGPTNINLTGAPSFFEEASCVLTEYYPDMDNDGFGDGSSTPTMVCIGAPPPTGYVNNNSDCDDNNNGDVFLTMNDNPIVNGIYQVNDSIFSIGLAASGSSLVNFKSGRVIVLDLGFVAEIGSDFLAEIESCAPMSPLVNQSPNEEIKIIKENLKPANPSSNNSFDDELELLIYPNPSKDETIISFDLSKSSNTKISIYNLNGKLVNELLQDFKTHGKHQVKFNTQNLSQGTYLVCFQTENQVITKKLVVL